MQSYHWLSGFGPLLSTPVDFEQHLWFSASTANQRPYPRAKDGTSSQRPSSPLSWPITRPSAGVLRARMKKWRLRVVHFVL